jgi:hypothetical protein
MESETGPGLPAIPTPEGGLLSLRSAYKRGTQAVAPAPVVVSTGISLLGRVWRLLWGRVQGRSMPC